jgi:hypothetical protein
MTLSHRWRLKDLHLRPAVSLALLILLGFGLRLTGLVWGQGWFHFGQGDGIEAYSVAVDYELGSQQAGYIGQPNFNQHSKLPGPLWTMFCYAGLRASRSIEGTVFLIIVLNTAAIGLIYLLARETLGQRAAIWAAVFAATCPWAVYYSVGVYNPDVMPFLGALLFLALWQASRTERSKLIFFVPILLLAMLQFHMSGLLLIPSIILIFVLCPARVDFRWLSAGFVAGFALYIPYIHGEMLRNWSNTKGMFAGGGGYSWDGLKALSAPISFLVNWAPRWTRSAAEYRELGRACFGFFGIFLAINLLSAMVALFLLSGAFVEIRQAMRGFLDSPRVAFAKSPGLVFLAILFVLPLLVALAFGKPFHTRYCLVLLPAELSLAAAATVHWFTFPVLGLGFRVGLLLTTCANVWLMPAMYHFQKDRIEHGATLIPSFRKLETIYQSLKTNAGPNSAVWVRALDSSELDILPEPVRGDICLVQRFVEIREKENHSAFAKHRLASYQLHCDLGRTTNSPAVAYRGNGIVLVEVRPDP